MARYEFLTTWILDAPIERVFDVLNDSAGYPDWWPGVRSVEVVERGDERGVGELARISMRSFLPYTLVFDTRVTRVERPHLIEGRSGGELEGTGTWRLFDSEAGTAAAYDWRVRTTRAWMNILGPLARPAFSWNHDHAMRQGGHGLAATLGATLIAHD